MSIVTRVEKINPHNGTRMTVEEPIATKASFNLFLNEKFVITLLATPKVQK
jgi:hypothetical protein